MQEYKTGRGKCVCLGKVVFMCGDARKDAGWCCDIKNGVVRCRAVGKVLFRFVDISTGMGRCWNLIGNVVGKCGCEREDVEKYIGEANGVGRCEDWKDTWGNVKVGGGRGKT